MEADADFGKVDGAGILVVGTGLEVAWVFAGGAVNGSRMCGGYDVVGSALLSKVTDECLEARRVLLETDRVLDERTGLGGREGFVVAQKVIGTAEIGLGAFVVASGNGVVGTLKETVFAVGDEFDRALRMGGVRGRA